MRNEREESVERYPLAWPLGWMRTRTYNRARAPFRSHGGRMTIAAAIDRLESQLTMLGAVNITLSTNLEVGLRGLPLSNQRQPDDPGAAVYFAFKGKATVLACDRWDSVADNITAIAQHIDALRRIERYGVGTIEQALAGYKALPADTAADWRNVLGIGGSDITVADVQEAHRLLARLHHPDRGGSEDKMTQLNRAREFALAELKA